MAPLDVTDRDASLALADRYRVTDIGHLAGTVPGGDPVAFFRTETTGLLNALDVARARPVRRFAVASSLGVYLGRAEIPGVEELPLPSAALRCPPPPDHRVQEGRRAARHVSSGRPFTNRELVDALRAVAPGARLDLRPGRQDGPGGDPHLDISRLTEDTGFTPGFDLGVAVADYVAWRAGNAR